MPSLDILEMTQGWDIVQDVIEEHGVDDQIGK